MFPCACSLSSPSTRWSLTGLVSSVCFATSQAHESTGSLLVAIKTPIQLSWGSFINGKRAFQFQMCGRLLNLRNKDVIVDAVMKSFQAYTPKPYLIPVNGFFPALNSAQVLEIPVGGFCGSVSSSPCGRYIASGSGGDIVLADANTGDILKRLHGHGDNVQCIKFAGTSKKLVTAHAEKTVLLWDWEELDSPTAVLEGHDDWVFIVAASRDGKRIFSGSEDGNLRIWNADSGLEIKKFEFNSAVRCFAVCEDDRKVGIGLRNGTLKVLESCTGENLLEVAGSTSGACRAMCCIQPGRAATYYRRFGLYYSCLGHRGSRRDWPSSSRS